jgi:D-alanyl-D-alanine carboxypeptidase
VRGALALLVAAACAPSANANPTLLFEPATATVLHAEEPDRLWHPASLTKLMTVYVVFEALKDGRLAWDADVPLSPYARGQPATRIGLKAGIKINVEQAVRGLILRSANDFAVALGERVSGTEAAFVEQMNVTARRLGMTRSVFRNPHGLPDADQVTTARDFAILVTALLKDFPDRAEVFATPTVHIHKGTFHSANDLLRTLSGSDGMKTGFTCASGYNVVASASRGGRRLVAIVLGAVNRGKRSERAVDLIEAGFAHLSTTLVTATADAPSAGPQAAASAKPMTASLLPKAAANADDEDGPDPVLAPKAARLHAPVAIMPVALNDLAVTPVEPPGSSAHNMSRDVRNGKCRGFVAFAKPVPPGSETANAAGDTTPAPTVAGVAAGAAKRATSTVVKDVTPAPEATPVVTGSVDTPHAKGADKPPLPRRADRGVRKDASPPAADGEGDGR